MDSRKHILIGVAAAVLLHVVVAIVLCIPGVLDALLAKKAPVVAKAEDKPSPVIRLQITPKKEVVPAPIPQPTEVAQRAKRRRFLQTNQANSAEAPKDPTFFGAHDNVAQSSAKAIAGAPQIAASAGEERNHINTESRFIDGKLNQPAIAPAQKPKVTEIPEPPQLKKEQSKNDTRAERAIAAQKRSPKYLESQHKAPVAKGEELAKKREDEAKKKAEALAKKAEEKRKRQEADRKRKEAQRKRELAAKKSGFQGRSDPTKNVGSIMRKGKVSSNNTAATPEGRYKQAVLNAINKDWNRRMGRHPDLALPGVLVVRWLVYPPGQVKGIRLVEEQHGSAIQKGITFQSIKQSKIPNMPSKVRSALHGEPMEFIVSFYF